MELTKITTYEQLKGELGSELHKAAISFVRIGYLLKLARDEDILADTSYADVNDFAESEFGLDKTQVSRFIRINDRFSIGGYSEHLKEEYGSYGSAKLSLMLTLPDEINAQLSPEYSKADIQTIKDEYDKEKKISDIEVMLEEKAPVDDFIAVIIKELNDEHPEPAQYFYESMERAQKRNMTPNEADAKEAYRPEGDKAYTIRVSGQGRFLATMKEDKVSIVNMRSYETSLLSWEDFTKALIADVGTREFKENREKEKTTPERKPKKVEVSRTKKEEVTDKNVEKRIKSVEKGERSEAEEIKAPDVSEKEEVAPVQPKENKNSVAEIDDRQHIAAAGDEEAMIMFLNDLLAGGPYNRALKYSESIEGLSHRDYRYQLDRISGWIADVKNTVNNLYAVLASRGQ